MITFELTKGNNTIEKLISRLDKDFPLSQISKVVQEDIQAETRKRGWKRIPNTIKRKVINANQHAIYLGGNKKDVEIATYLDTGTKGHFIKPLKKKALSWVSDGARFFSKGHFVKGIKPTNFFRIYPQTLSKISAIITKVFRN